MARPDPAVDDPLRDLRASITRSLSARLLSLCLLASVTAHAGVSCHDACPKPAPGTCDEMDELVQVCRPAPEFPDPAVFQAYLNASPWVDQTFEAVEKALDALDFQCGHPQRRPITEWQCTRAVKVPHCRLELQVIVLTLEPPQAVGEGPPPRTPDFHRLARTLRVTTLAASLGSTGDSDCQPGGGTQRR